MNQHEFCFSSPVVPIGSAVTITDSGPYGGLAGMEPNGDLCEGALAVEVPARRTDCVLERRLDTGLREQFTDQPGGAVLLAIDRPLQRRPGIVGQMTASPSPSSIS